MVKWTICDEGGGWPFMDKVRRGAPRTFGTEDSARLFLEEWLDEKRRNIKEPELLKQSIAELEALQARISANWTTRFDYYLAGLIQELRKESGSVAYVVVEAPVYTPESWERKLAGANDRWLKKHAAEFEVSMGIKALPAEVQAAIRQKVASYDAFEDDATDASHDKGAFEHEGHHIVWHIDYYTSSKMEELSENPENPKTFRVLESALKDERR
jgi:Protein of unknown function (DUF3768)